MGALERYKARERRIEEFDGLAEDNGYTPEMVEALMGDVYPKDLRKGMITLGTVVKVEKDYAELQTPALAAVFVDTDRENRFLDAMGVAGLVPGDEFNVLIESVKNGELYGSIEKATEHSSKMDFKDALMNADRAYEGVVKSFNDGGFIVTIGQIDCFMPNSHAGANRITDQASMIGKSVKVMVEAHIEATDMYVVSARKYIKRILPDEIGRLDLLAMKTGKVTGVTPYGVFVEWEQIFTGLIYGEEAEEGWKDWESGRLVDFHIKEVRQDDKIVLTQRGASADIVKLIDFKAAHEGTIIDGYVSEITSTPEKGVTGAVVEVFGVSGFLPAHQMRNMPKFKDGDLIEVLVGSVDVASRRVSLRSPKLR